MGISYHNNRYDNNSLPFLLSYPQEAHNNAYKLNILGFSRLAILHILEIQLKLEIAMTCMKSPRNVQIEIHITPLHEIGLLFSH